MDASTGNMSPNSEAEELCREETRDCSIYNWNAFDEATMRTDAWSSDEEHEPLPHRQGERRQRRRECLNSDSSGVAKGTSTTGTVAWIFPGLLATTESHGPSRAQSSIIFVTGLITQRRGLELANRLSSCIGDRFDEACDIKVDRDRTMDWHIIVQGVVGMFGIVPHDRIQQDGHQNGQ